MKCLVSDQSYSHIFLKSQSYPCTSERIAFAKNHVNKDERIGFTNRTLNEKGCRKENPWVFTCTYVIRYTMVSLEPSFLHRMLSNVLCRLKHWCGSQSQRSIRVGKKTHCLSLKDVNILYRIVKLKQVLQLIELKKYQPNTKDNIGLIK